MFREVVFSCLSSWLVVVIDIVVTTTGLVIDIVGMAMVIITEATGMLHHGG
jgi:hypothetical protein